MADDGTANDPTLRSTGPGGTARYPAPGDWTVATPPPPRVQAATDGPDGPDGPNEDHPEDEQPDPQPDDDLDGIVVTSYEDVPPVRAEGSEPPASAPVQGQDADPDVLDYGLPGPGAAPAPDDTPPGGVRNPVSPSAPAGRYDHGHRHRHRRQTVTFLALLGSVVVLGLLAAAMFAGVVPSPFGSPRRTTATSCATPTPTVQAAAQTRVRVYNASNRRGLALTTARELQKRGFKVPQAPGNDPQESKPTSAAVVRHGSEGLLAARTIATQVKGAVVYQQDDRLGEDVDLVLGQTFALVDPKAGAAALKVTTPAPSCAAVG